MVIGIQYTNPTIYILEDLNGDPIKKLFIRKNYRKKIRGYLELTE